MRMKKGLITPKGRSEMEHRVYLSMETVLRQTRPGQEINPFAVDLLRDLAKINVLPNGRMNIQAINEQVRLHGNSLHSFSFLRGDSNDNL